MFLKYKQNMQDHSSNPYYGKPKEEETFLINQAPSLKIISRYCLVNIFWYCLSYHPSYSVRASHQDFALVSFLLSDDIFKI